MFLLSLFYIFPFGVSSVAPVAPVIPVNVLTENEGTKSEFQLLQELQPQPQPQFELHCIKTEKRLKMDI